MNEIITMKQEKDTDVYESRTPGLLSLTGPPNIDNVLGLAAEKAATMRVRRQKSCVIETDICNCSEESVKKFNLLLNKMHNLVDTSPDKPKMGLSEIPVVEHSRSEV